jgi:hypothetical protein
MIRNAYRDDVELSIDGSRRQPVWLILSRLMRHGSLSSLCFSDLDDEFSSLVELVESNDFRS